MSAARGCAVDHEVLDRQREHWEKALAGHPEMFGTEPSAPARAAATLFGREGKTELLELGAGHGRDTLYFARERLRVRALDYAEEAVQEILAKARAADLASSVSASRHDVREPLPFADGSIDACYSHMLFCMALTTPELERLAAEVRRVLRPGGLHVYTVRTTADAHYRAGIARGDDMFEVGGYIVHFFSRALVERLAAGHKLLEVVEFEEGSLPRCLFRVTMRKADGDGSGVGTIGAASASGLARETVLPESDATRMSGAIAEVRQELNRVLQVKKCQGCECLFDVFGMVGDDLAAIGTLEAQEAEAQVRAWLHDRPAKAHGCLGCAICLPVPPYNRFSELLKVSQASPQAVAAGGAACGCGDT